MAAERILIVGGGIGGLTLGAALRRQGLSPLIVERAPEWAPVGAGIVLGPNAMAIMRELGVAEALESLGTLVGKSWIADYRGKVLASVDFESLRENFGSALALHRADLHEVLLSANDAQSIRLGATVETIEQDDARVRVTFSDRTMDDFDLVIGADGLRSQVRYLIHGEIPLRYSGYTCWRFVVQGDFGDVPTAEMWGRGQRFGVVPIGQDRVYCYATRNAPRGSAEMAELRPDGFRALFHSFQGPVPRLLQALGSDGTLIHNDLEQVQLDRWVKGRVALLGDAAHGMTPNLGQGAAMAIEDAIVLSRELTGSASLTEALGGYEGRRKKRVGSIQRRSWSAGKVGQWESPMACAIRNGLTRFTPNAFAISSLRRLLMQEL